MKLISLLNTNIVLIYYFILISDVDPWGFRV